MPKPKNICVAKGCKKKVHSRGLCATHYEIARRAVINGETTWDAMTKAGLAATKKYQGGQPSDFSQAIKAIGQKNTP